MQYPQNMKGRTVVSALFSGLLLTGLGSALVGCSDSSPLRSTAPQPGVRASAAVTAASTTQFDGFINFCQGKTLTNGKQVKQGSCNPIRKFLLLYLSSIGESDQLCSHG